MVPLNDARMSKASCVSITATVAPTPQDAVVSAKDDLPAAEEGPCPRGHGTVDTMSHVSQCGHEVRCMGTIFDGHGFDGDAVGDAEPRLVERRLWIEPQVSECHNQLHMPLWLHEPAHARKACHKSSTGLSSRLSSSRNRVLAAAPRGDAQQSCWCGLPRNGC